MFAMSKVVSVAVSASLAMAALFGCASAPAANSGQSDASTAKETSASTQQEAAGGDASGVGASAKGDAAEKKGTGTSPYRKFAPSYKGCKTITRFAGDTSKATVDITYAGEERYEKVSYTPTASGDTKSYTFVYDNDGKLLDGATLNISEYRILNAVSPVKYQRNAQGDVTEEHNPDSGATHTYAYEYDTQGRITRKTASESKSSVVTAYQYEYDNNGDTTSETTLLSMDGNEWVKSVRKYAYDGERRLIREDKASYADDGSGTLTREETITYAYDDNGRLTYAGNGSPTTRFGSDYSSYTYDEKGNMTMVVDVDSGTTRDVEFSYDDKGRLVSAKVTSDNKSWGTERTEYTY